MKIVSGMEQITGPWEGMYIAAYTIELDGMFYGYAKLSAACPEDVWTAEAVRKVTTEHSYVEEARALGAVHDLAFRWISEFRAPHDEAFWSSLIAAARRQP